MGQWRGRGRGKAKQGGRRRIQGVFALHPNVFYIWARAWGLGPGAWGLGPAAWGWSQFATNSVNWNQLAPIWTQLEGNSQFGTYFYDFVNRFFLELLNPESVCFTPPSTTPPARQFICRRMRTKGGGGGGGGGRKPSFLI